jgi:hypothetical protein
MIKEERFNQKPRIVNIARELKEAVPLKHSKLNVETSPEESRKIGLYWTDVTARGFC